MTIKKALDLAINKLREAHIISPQLDAQLLLSNAINKPKEFIISNPDTLLTDSETRLFEEYVSRRIDREPVCYITNSVEFYGNEFFVDNRVLSPRAETETIVANVIQNAVKGSQLIDIGTGSGAIAVSVAINRADLKITATEISRVALDVAEINAKKFGVENRIKFIESDIFSNIKKRYDTVVTNLPYVSSDQKNDMQPEVKKEPAVALYGGAGDGLDIYRKFYKQIPEHINSGGVVYHESDPWQHSALKTIAEQLGFELILDDYFILGFRYR